jgi:hypothetical protein
MSENYVLLQVSSNSNLILQLYGAPIHLAGVCEYLKVNFPSRWRGGEGPIAWPYRSHAFKLPSFGLLTYQV